MAANKLPKIQEESTKEIDHLRLITKIAVLYHQENYSQPDIANRLKISQARVSRYLKEAQAEGIVQTTVVQPYGIYVGLEKALEEMYGLREVIVVENIEGTSIITALASAAATYLETTLNPHDVIGLSSWSTTLLATVDAMRSRPRKNVKEVIQLIGGVGSPEAQLQASRLVSHLAKLTLATPIYMPAPGVTATPKIRDAFLSDPAVKQNVEAWSRISTLLVGIGTFPASPLLVASGNALSREDEIGLTQLGAVGEICLRYFDKNGKPMKPEVEQRVISIDFNSMMKIPNRIAVAGGTIKQNAIRAAIKGGWVNVLITDSLVARNLLEPPRKKK